MKPEFVTEPKSPFEVLREDYHLRLEASFLAPEHIQIALSAFDLSIPEYYKSFGYQVSGPWGVDSELTPLEALNNVKTYAQQYPAVDPRRHARAYVVPMYTYGDITIEGENIEIVDADEIKDLVKQMADCLGPTLVASALGAESSEVVRDWVSPERDGLVLPHLELERLRYMIAAWTVLSQAEGDEVARAWFTGGNPLLNEDTPITAIRENRQERVFHAALSFVRNDWAG